LRDNCRMHI